MISQMMAQRIEHWPLDKLIPFARNPRTHSVAQVARIAASIGEFGFNNPILVDTKAGIIAGHGRLLAARKLGLKEVPVIVLDHLTEAQKRSYIIADNQLALNAGWNDEILQQELRALQEENFDVSPIGFEDEELARLLAAQDATQGLTDEDSVPELPDIPVTVLDDVWLCGKHRVLCSDATSMDAIEKILGDGLADMVFCDPPYSVLPINPKDFRVLIRPSFLEQRSRLLGELVRFGNDSEVGCGILPIAFSERRSCTNAHVDAPQRLKSLRTSRFD